MAPVIFIATLALLLTAAAIALRQRSMTFRVPATLASVRRIGRQVKRFVRYANLDEEAAFQCQLAVDEAAANIIRHSYPNNAGGAIEVFLQAVDGEFTIHLTDFGIPYDPEMIKARQKDLLLEAARPGGWGLYFMRAMMDEVTYTPSPHGNSLVMVKRRMPVDG
ncbi:MAG: hypothetical protein Kow00124_04720 [Anaerolineae bacterium]